MYIDFIPVDMNLEIYVMGVLSHTYCTSIYIVRTYTCTKNKY